MEACNGEDAWGRLINGETIIQGMPHDPKAQAVVAANASIPSEIIDSLASDTEAVGHASRDIKRHYIVPSPR
jgi:hypothetical protein